MHHRADAVAGNGPGDEHHVAALAEARHALAAEGERLHLELELVAGRAAAGAPPALRPGAPRSRGATGARVALAGRVRAAARAAPSVRGGGSRPAPRSAGARRRGPRPRSPRRGGRAGRASRRRPRRPRPAARRRACSAASARRRSSASSSSPMLTHTSVYTALASADGVAGVLVAASRSRSLRRDSGSSCASA